MVDLPTGSYNSSVTGESFLAGKMDVGGTNDAPTVTYESIDATNVTWNADTGTLSFTVEVSDTKWDFSGTYDDSKSPAKFDGTASEEGREGGPEHWTATAESPVGAEGSGSYHAGRA